MTENEAKAIKWIKSVRDDAMYLLIVLLMAVLNYIEDTKKHGIYH